MFTRVCLHALRLAYGFFYSLTPLGFKRAVPSFYSSLLPVLTSTATRTTGAADTQLYGDNKNPPPPVPVNKIFVWFHFYRMPFLKQPGQLNICQLTIMCYIKKHLLLISIWHNLQKVHSGSSLIRGCVLFLVAKKRIGGPSLFH